MRFPKYLSVATKNMIKIKRQKNKKNVKTLFAKKINRQYSFAISKIFEITRTVKCTQTLQKTHI